MLPLVKTGDMVQIANVKMAAMKKMPKNEK